MTKPILVVMAAGLGSRFGGLKQFEPVGPHGESLLDYSVFDALRAGFGRVVFVIRRETAEAFDARVASRYRTRAPIDCAFQSLDDVPAGFAVPEGRTRPWGTLHAVLAARHKIDAPFAVLNADDFYGRDSYLQAARFLQALPPEPPVPCCLVGYRLRATLSEGGGVHRAVGIARDGLLQHLAEHRDLQRDADGLCRGHDASGRRVVVPDDALVSMNFWGFAPTVLAPMAAQFESFLRAHGDDPKAECLLPDFVDHAVREGDARCHVLDGGGSWFGLTHPEDKADCARRLTQLSAQGDYEAPLWR